MENNELEGEVIFDVTDSAPAPPAPPAPIPGVTVSPEGKARAERDARAASAAGFALKPPIYAIGTLVNETGQDNFRQSRRDFEHLPEAQGALWQLAGRVKDEGRENALVRASSLRLDHAGRLTRGQGALPVSERAFKSLCSSVTPGGGGYLAQCPPALRAHNVNHWIKTGADQDPERELTLRLRKNEGQREVFAVVGPRYAAYDADKIALEVARALPQGARAELVYDGYRFGAHVLFHTDVQPENAVAGEIFKAGIYVRSADDGSGSIKIGAEVWRNLCLNLIVIDHARKETFRRRHVGDSIGDAIRVGVAQALDSIGHFRQAWGFARALDVVERYDMEVKDIFRALVRDEKVNACYRADVVVDRLVSAWQLEPGKDAASIVNAITRAAHDAAWASPWVSEQLEQDAGKLLFSKDWRLAPIEVR